MAVDSNLYLGNMFHSIERLPQWYQVVAIFAVFSLFPLRDTAVVGWLVSSLHNSFGTEMVWSDEYQRLLELMSFNERICFTLYGVALFLLALIAYKLLCGDALQVGLHECGIIGGRKWWPMVILFTALGCQSMVLIKEVVAMTFSNPLSPAGLTIGGLNNTKELPLDPRLEKGNMHFIVQLKILKNLIFFFLQRSVPATIIACGYRLVRDVPRKIHAALRWYLVTFLFARTLVMFYVVYRHHEWHRLSAWLQCFFTLSLLAAVNYAYGPNKRGGWTEATSFMSSTTQTLLGIVKCASLLFIVSIVTLALVVSVHVVELVLIWLIMFMATLWVPAIIDSCAVEYIASIVAVVSHVGYKMGYNSEWGASRMWALLSVWWIDVCLLYNLSTNLFRSRYGGIAVLAAFAMWIVRLAAGHSKTYDIFFLVEANVAVLSALSLGKKTPPNASLFARLLYSTSFGSLLQLSMVVGVFLIMGILLISIIEPPVVREHRLRLNITLVTPAVFFRKLVKTFVLAACWAIVMVTTLILNNHLLPRLTKMTPDFVLLFISLGISCTILGGLMDVKDTLYIGALRLLGALEPPSLNEDDKEM